MRAARCTMGGTLQGDRDWNDALTMAFEARLRKLVPPVAEALVASVPRQARPSTWSLSRMRTANRS